MADLRDQLRKAGLVSEKQLRQAKHQERLHAAELGHAGLEAERREREERERKEAEARREAARAREEERRRARQEEGSARRVEQLIRSCCLLDATSGTRRFFFETQDGMIRFLDVSDSGARKLATGSAAIVETRGMVRGEYCVIDARAAAELAAIDPRIFCFWNRGEPAGATGHGGGPAG